MEKEEFTNRIVFTTEDGGTEAFFIEEQTILNGRTYLLVTKDGDSEETEAYILRDTSEGLEEEAVYSMVTDEEEMSAVAGVFEELLEDVDISL